MRIGISSLTRKASVDAEFAVTKKIDRAATKEAAKMAIKSIECSAR
jgi:hypothetical protein